MEAVEAVEAGGRLSLEEKGLGANGIGASPPSVSATYGGWI